jgi:hypothetical protein
VEFFLVVCFIYLYPKPESHSEYGSGLPMKKLFQQELPHFRKKIYVAVTPNEYGSDRFRPRNSV